MTGKDSKKHWFRLSVPDLWAVAALALLVAAMFGDALFVPGDKIASSGRCDVYDYFAESRTFGFGQIHDGHVPLWNPYLFSGTPFLGNFQSALFYPPNMIYLFLPLAKAINLDMAFHVLVLGLLMYAWGRFHKLVVAGAFLGAVMAMFSSCYFLHVLAGHLTMLAVLAWTPLVFLAVEHILDRPSIAWTAVGAIAVTLQILAGLPQGVFFTGFAVGIYSLLRLPQARNRLRILAALAAMAAFPVLLSAPQLWTGIETARESTRNGGVDYLFASSYSFPPVNLLMLFTPGIFGDFMHYAYWGKWAFWEVSFFVGVTGLFLSILGAMSGPRRRLHWAAMVVLLVLVALGGYAPWFPFFYNYVPGFDLFRGTGRILFFATLFLGLLAGAGLSTLLKSGKYARVIALVSLGIAIAAAVGAIEFQQATDSSTAQFTSWRTFIIHMWEGEIPKPTFVQKSAQFSSGELARVVDVCLVLAVLFWFAAKKRWAAYAIMLVGVAELCLFARTHRDAFHLSQITNTELREFAGAHRGDFRILDASLTCNRAMMLGIGGIWGYDPVMTRRYVEFMAFTQNTEIEDIEWGLNLSHVMLDPLFAMLRLEYVVPPATSKPPPVQTLPDKPLPRFLLVHDYRVAHGKNAVFAAMKSPDFSPQKTVILEVEPNPPPAPNGKGGIIALTNDHVDSMELKLDLPEPAILLITDAYSKHWRVRPLASSPPQTRYDLLPANSILRAIPLAAGEHHFVVEYAPASYCIGKWIAVVVEILVVVAAIASMVASGFRVARPCRGRAAKNGSPPAGTSYPEAEAE